MASKIRRRINRGKTITIQGFLGNKRPLSLLERQRLLKAALFSNSVWIRRKAAETLTQRGQFNFLLQMAQRFNRKMVPEEFFTEDFQFGEFPFSSGKANRDFKERFFEGYKKGPLFRFKGFEVFEMKGLHHGGIMYYGKIFLEKGLPTKLKRVICAHEVGEIFNHDVGIAMELLEMKRQNAEKEYLQLIMDDSAERLSAKRLRQTYCVCDMMEGMTAVKEKIIQIIHKKFPSVERGP